MVKQWFIKILKKNVLCDLSFNNNLSILLILEFFQIYHIFLFSERRIFQNFTIIRKTPLFAKLKNKMVKLVKLRFI